MSNEVVVVTGGSSGYGFAMAKIFHEHGYRVLITARNREKLENAKKSIGCDAFAMDVTKPVDWEKLRNYVLNQCGKVDILINNAGGGVAIKETADISYAEIDEVFNLNLKSAIYGSKTFVPIMQERKTGTIVNMSSVCAKEAWPAWTVYAASKWGVLGFSKGLYTEVQPFGIRVTCIIPAAASTGFQQSSGIDPVNQLLHPDDVAKVVFDVCGLPKHVVIEEITIWGIDQVVVPL